MLAENIVVEFSIQLDDEEIHLKMFNTLRESIDVIIEYWFRSSSQGRKYKLSHKAIIKYTCDGLRYRDL